MTTTINEVKADQGVLHHLDDGSFLFTPTPVESSPERDAQPAQGTNSEVLSKLRELQGDIIGLRTEVISLLEQKRVTTQEAEPVLKAGQRVEEAAAAAEANPTPENLERVQEEVAGLNSAVARIDELERWRREEVDPNLARLNAAVFDENGNPRVATTVVGGEEAVVDTDRNVDVSVAFVIAVGLLFGAIAFLLGWALWGLIWALFCFVAVGGAAALLAAFASLAHNRRRS